MENLPNATSRNADVIGRKCGGSVIPGFCNVGADCVSRRLKQLNVWADCATSDRGGQPSQMRLMLSLYHPLREKLHGELPPDQLYWYRRFA